MGGNVLFKHRVWMLSQASQQWVETVLTITEKSILDESSSIEENSIKQELSALKNYILCLVVDCFSPPKLDEPLEKGFVYDILAWFKQRTLAALSDFAVSEPIALKFCFGDNTIAGDARRF